MMVAEVLEALGNSACHDASPLRKAMLACCVLVSRAKMFMAELSLKWARCRCTQRMARKSIVKAL